MPSLNRLVQNESTANGAEKPRQILGAFLHMLPSLIEIITILPSRYCQSRGLHSMTARVDLL
jgi:hypothetical protein